jgi:hypothetical protein
MAITLDGTNGINSSGVIVAPDGSASAPAITNDGDTNTGIFFPAADTIAFAEGGAEVARFDSSGNLGIGTTSPAQKLHLAATTAGINIQITNDAITTYLGQGGTGSTTTDLQTNGALRFNTGASFTERMRITSAGALLVGKTAVDALSTAGIEINDPSASLYMGLTSTRADGFGTVFRINRQSSDGTLIDFHQAATSEGNISVSGTTVSYNGGHLSRWAQTTTAKDESLKKGTVLSNLDEMNLYVDADGNPVENEQLNKVKVSDVEGDANVAGVFVNWTYDEAHQVDEINMAMTGDMIIRIAQGTTVARGDLLMSAGDGTAKPQGDDIVRSKTIAKVTSTHVTCTYDDGSYCVPCVLMAC